MTEDSDTTQGADDTAGHLNVRQDAQPGFTGALNDPTAPKTDDDDDDDTAGHLNVRQDAQPGFSGSLSVDPTTQS